MSKHIVEVYPIVFIQDYTDVQEMLNELEVETTQDLEDFQIFKYLEQWSDDTNKTIPSIHGLEHVNTPFLGQACFYNEKDDELTFPSVDELEEADNDTYIYLLSINHGLGYFGLSAARIIKVGR